MNNEVIEYGVRFTLDPTGHYRTRVVTPMVALKGCLDGCGLLTSFAIGTKDTIAENMEDAYQFGMGWQDAAGDKAEIIDGVFHYPEDPPMHPYMKMQRLEGDQDEVYVYPHAIVCVVRDGKLVKRQRMD